MNEPHHKPLDLCAPDDFAVIYYNSSRVHKIPGAGCFQKAKDWVREQLGWTEDLGFRRTSPRDEPTAGGLDVVDACYKGDDPTGYSVHWCSPVTEKVNVHDDLSSPTWKWNDPPEKILPANLRFGKGHIPPDIPRSGFIKEPLLNDLSIILPPPENDTKDPA